MQDGLTERAEQYCKKHNLIAGGDRVYVGLSGGADSVCLLLVLLELRERLNFKVGAFHVNHGIRGAAADADEQYCRSLCRQLGVPFTAVRADVPAEAKKLGIGLEEAGRLVRYREAERLLTEQGYTKLALAHHRGDVAETFLFHLFRGSSLAGLASIPAKRGVVIRPLLFCEKEELVAYLAEKNVSFCTDETNTSTEYARNKIRHELLPEAAKINAGAVLHLAQTAEELREVDEYLEAEAEKLVGVAEVIPGGVQIPTEVLLSGPHVLQAKAAFLLLSGVTGQAKNLTRTHVEQLLTLCRLQSGKRMEFPYAVTARISFGKLILRKEQKQPETETVPAAKEIPVQVPGEYLLEDGRTILRFRCISRQKNEQIPKNEYTKWFDYGKITGALKLRTRQEGDVLGMLKGRKSLKQVFTEQRIDIGRRNTMLLLADAEQILWVPGVRACDNCRVDDSTVTILEVQMNGGTDYEG